MKRKEMPATVLRKIRENRSKHPDEIISLLSQEVEKLNNFLIEFDIAIKGKKEGEIVEVPSDSRVNYLIKFASLHMGGLQNEFKEHAKTQDELYSIKACFELKDNRELEITDFHRLRKIFLSSKEELILRDIAFYRRHLEDKTFAGILLKKEMELEFLRKIK